MLTREEFKKNPELVFDKAYGSFQDWQSEILLEMLQESRKTVKIMLLQLILTARLHGVQMIRNSHC